MSLPGHDDRSLAARLTKAAGEPVRRLASLADQFAWGRHPFEPSDRADEADGAELGRVRFWRDPGTGTLQATYFPPPKDHDR